MTFKVPGRSILSVTKCVDIFILAGRDLVNCLKHQKQPLRISELTIDNVVIASRKQGWLTLGIIPQTHDPSDLFVDARFEICAFKAVVYENCTR